jgi:hypothetical protein
VTLTLRPGEAGLILRPAVTNPGEAPQTFQFWLNAMLAPGGASAGPGLRFYLPAEQVVVHSHGDSPLPPPGTAMAWPRYGGRDLSRYGEWSDWLASLRRTWRHPTRRSMTRTQGGPGAHLSGGGRHQIFGFGGGYADTATYTDDGNQYVELWGGWTPTYWDTATLAPGETVPGTRPGTWVRG